MSWTTATRKGEPVTGELNTGHLRIIVSRWTDGDPDRWYLTCWHVGLSRHELSAPSLLTAKLEALSFVQRRLAVFTRSVNAAIEAMRSEEP
jgi:hypothetical protein